MLTDLTWLDKGKAYPPPSEIKRIKTYQRNEALFLTKHAEVWQESYDSLCQQLRKKNRSIGAVLNYHQLLSKKTADFVCSEPPSIETEQDTDALMQALRKCRFFAQLYECMIDVSRYGNAVVKIVDKRLSVIPPRCWFPVVDPTDQKHIAQHVIAFPVNPDAQGNCSALHVEIHAQGSVEIRKYPLSYQGTRDGIAQYEIGTLQKKSTPQSTGLNEFAIQPLTNVTHSGSLFGLNDYEIVNSILKTIMWRLHCADTIMDKHSEPSMSGPSSALTVDERTGLYLIQAGNYFKRDNKEDPDMQYVTWDGNLESNFKEIDTLLNQLYIITEMGAAFLEGSEGGSVASGTALKLRLVSPRIKAQRLVGLNDATVRTIIHLLASVNGISLNEDSFQLIWNDGLPDDPVEDAARRSVETAGKATKSQYSAIKERGLSDDDAEAELEQMIAEAAMFTPQVLSGDPDFTRSADEPQDKPEAPLAAE